jgi:predicted dehydrogenase
VFKALIIGCGNVAGGYDLLGAKREVWTHAKAYQLTPGVDLVGVLDVSAAKAKQFAQTWQVPFAGTDLAKALKATKPDLVSICSPTETHAPLIKELCRAGIGGILCEKPIAYDVREAEQVVDLCEKESVLLAINYQRNWDRQSNKLRDAIGSGDFGRTELIRVLYSKGLIHSGSHFVSLLSRWFGEVRIERILSRPVCDRHDVRADFVASCPATSKFIFQYVPEQTYAVNEIEILFERGRLELRRGGLDILWTDRHHDPLLPNDSTLAQRSKRLPVSLPRAMLDVVRNFTATLRGRETLLSEPRAALQTLRACARVRTLSHRFLKS